MLRRLLKSACLEHLVNFASKDVFADIDTLPSYARLRPLLCLR